MTRRWLSALLTLSACSGAPIVSSPPAGTLTCTEKEGAEHTCLLQAIPSEGTWVKVGSLETGSAEADRRSLRDAWVVDGRLHLLFERYEHDGVSHTMVLNRHTWDGVTLSSKELWRTTFHSYPEVIRRAGPGVVVAMFSRNGETESAGFYLVLKDGELVEHLGNCGGGFLEGDARAVEDGVTTAVFALNCRTRDLHTPCASDDDLYVVRFDADRLIDKTCLDPFFSWQTRSLKMDERGVIATSLNARYQEATVVGTQAKDVVDVLPGGYGDLRPVAVLSSDGTRTVSLFNSELEGPIVVTRSGAEPLAIRKATPFGDAIEWAQETADHVLVSRREDGQLHLVGRDGSYQSSVPLPLPPGDGLAPPPLLVLDGSNLIEIGSRVDASANRIEIWARRYVELTTR